MTAYMKSYFISPQNHIELDDYDQTHIQSSSSTAAPNSGINPISARTHKGLWYNFCNIIK